MQRSGFRVIASDGSGQDDVFGWMAGGRTSTIAADVALTGSAVPYHSLAVVAGQTYAVRSVSFVDVTVIGSLWVGFGPLTATASLVLLSALFRTNTTGTSLFSNDTGTGLLQEAATIAATGAMQVVMDGYIAVTASGTARITHAVTGGAAGTLKVGSFATIHRLS